MNIAHLTRGRALRTLIAASAERRNSLSVHAKHIRTHCIRTIDVPIYFDFAIAIMTISGECATHRNSSQKIHSCLQRKIGSGKSGEFRDG